MKEFKLGVYIKPNGNLITVSEIKEAENVNFKYEIMDGTKWNSFPYSLLSPVNRPYKTIGSSSLSLGWGPSAFMNKCEYLTEL